MKYKIMIPVLLFSFLSFAEFGYFSAQYKEKDDPAKYLPVEIGNKWIYQNKYRSSTTGKETEIITVTWESNYEILEHYVLPEGLLVVRKESIRNVVYDYPDTMKDNVSWFTENIPRENNFHWLLAENYVYRIPNHVWLSKSNCLSEDFTKRLANGELTPIFFFPLDSVGVWAEKERELIDIEKERLFIERKGPAPNPVMYYWMVEENEDVQVPYGDIPDVFKLIYRTHGGPTIRWFKSGIGVVKEVYHHQGSLIENESVLVSFTKGISK